MVLPLADYRFYKDGYKGSQISETCFPEMIARAEDWLAKLEQIFRVTPCGENGRDLALCAIAEIMAADRKRRYLSETAVGDVKIKFFNEDDAALYRRIYNQISCFLKIKRGVE